jgi:hypothetical protein
MLPMPIGSIQLKCPSAKQSVDPGYDQFKRNQALPGSLQMDNGKLPQSMIP